MAFVTIVAKSPIYDEDHDDDQYVSFQVPENSHAFRLFQWMAERAKVQIYELPTTPNARKEADMK